ncbi:sugar transferase [Niastella populi]|uniref:UDP-galactose phosphate transferase n=1 Tax=Niastella populi TaxID=550983 RepID=A0A1V9GA35_9BACT|nr:sugar transferase [Niastella populi]OQP67519.1 UDP-galactose phosphate transferase [Niastella populi]
MQFYRNYFKRFLDLIVSLVAFSLLLPVFIIVTALLYIANQGKPFFVQPRPGRNGRIFRLVKFKTMNDRKDAAGNLLSDAERLTAVGRFIRKTSLDEIPQLINVIKGEMSLIGPRPLLVEYLPLYNSTQKRRHEVRPGITGWAQVNGRNAIGWKEKFELDVWYVDNMSFLLDCKIIVFTLTKVVKSEGVSQQGHVTMTKFTGN